MQPASSLPSRVRQGATLRRLLGRFAALPGRTAAVFTLLAVRSVLDVLPPLLVASLLDLLVGREGRGGDLPSPYLWGVVLLAGALLGKLVASYLAQAEAARLGQDLENGLRRDLFHKVLHLPFAWHDANQTGKTIARSLRDMEKARRFFREVAYGYLEGVLLVIAAVATSFAIHWSYGVVVSGTFGLGVGLTWLVGRRVAWMDRVVSDRYDAVATALQENVAGARVVRAFGREAAESRRFAGHLDVFSRRWSALNRFWTGLMPLVGHAYAVSFPLVLLVGALRERGGVQALGEVAAVLLYARTVGHRLRPLTRLVVLGQEALASASRVFEVLDAPEGIGHAARGRPLPAGRGEVRFEGVRFAHEGAAESLRGVDLHVPGGSSLGILGATGSGKSTLVKLLPRFYDPTSGVVRLDGVPLRDLDLAALRRAVAVVFQEPFLFSGTVAENVAYARPDASREEVEQAACLAAADGFVRRLPAGYETVIGERGVSLSGGQRQRLTIARALLQDPRVLVFDDATASVDVLTERALFRGVRTAARGRTTLVVSQRVSSLAWCDRIAVLADGVVSAVGPHALLLEQSPLYRDVHERQQLVGEGARP